MIYNASLPHSYMLINSLLSPVALLLLGADCSHLSCCLGKLQLRSLCVSLAVVILVKWAMSWFYTWIVIFWLLTIACSLSTKWVTLILALNCTCTVICAQVLDLFCTFCCASVINYTRDSQTKGSWLHHLTQLCWYRNLSNSCRRLAQKARI